MIAMLGLSLVGLNLRALRPKVCSVGGLPSWLRSITLGFALSASHNSRNKVRWKQRRGHNHNKILTVEGRFTPVTRPRHSRSSGGET